MKLHFAVVKNQRGYQAECLEMPQIIACGWTWEQLLDSIIDHTQAFLDELPSSTIAPTQQNNIYCGSVTVQITNCQPHIIEQHPCD